MSDTVTAPEGYISLGAAIDRYVKTVLGGWEPDTYVKVRLTKAEAREVGVRAGKTVERLDGRAGREQHRVAAAWLREELSSEALIAVVEATGGRRTLPASFWKGGPWRDTLHTGHIGHVEHVHEWQSIEGRPVFVEHRTFRNRLNHASRQSRRIASRHQIREYLEKACREMPGEKTPEIQAHAKAMLKAEDWHVPKDWLRDEWQQIDPSLRPKVGRPSN
jgi:hypothetical protein